MAPAGESIMSVLPPEQAGAGSAINDTVQELGGSLGIAIIGSIVATSFRHGLAASNLPAPVQHAAGTSIAAADAIAAHAGPFGPHLLSVAHDSFTTAVTTGFTVAGAIALAAALVTAAALPRRQAKAAAQHISTNEARQLEAAGAR
jgi:MFS transporter, DHA2 family, multidrug resistance protein